LKFSDNSDHKRRYVANECSLLDPIVQKPVA
jgi:hypothetical protein